MIGCIVVEKSRMERQARPLDCRRNTGDDQTEQPDQDRRLVAAPIPQREGHREEDHGWNVVDDRHPEMVVDRRDINRVGEKLDQGRLDHATPDGLGKEEACPDRPCSKRGGSKGHDGRRPQDTGRRGSRIRKPHVISPAGQRRQSHGKKEDREETTDLRPFAGRPHEYSRKKRAFERQQVISETDHDFAHERFTPHSFTRDCRGAGLRRRYRTGGLRFPARLNSAAHAGWSSGCRLFRQDRIRPPPGAMPLQNFSASALHSSRTLSAFSARAFERSRHAGESSASCAFMHFAIAPCPGLTSPQNFLTSPAQGPSLRCWAPASAAMPEVNSTNTNETNVVLINMVPPKFGYEGG